MDVQTIQLLELVYRCSNPWTDNTQRRAAYNADITYGTNNEFDSTT